MAALAVPDYPSTELARVADRLPMRGVVDGLITPRPIGATLPALLQEDDFCMRLTQAFDDVIAPVFAALDCIDTYFDPHLAPEDFVSWLGSWVGVEIDENWAPERLRRLVSEVVALYRIRGTAAGLAAHVSLYAGVTPEIDESGGCGWSQTADSELPGSPEPNLVVRLRVDDPDEVKRSSVSHIVEQSRPAHVPYQLEILVGGAPDEGAEAEEEAALPAAAADAPGAIDLPGSERIELAAHGPPSQEELDQPPDRSPDDNESTD